MRDVSKHPGVEKVENGRVIIKPEYVFLGQTIYEYIRDRAKEEGVVFSLDLDFFVAHVASGVRSVFGVQIDDDANPTGDQQEPFPGFFDEWLDRYLTRIEAENEAEGS